jgi:hypothetical protein
MIAFLLRNLLLMSIGFTFCGLPVKMAGGPPWAWIGFGTVGILLVLVGTQVGANTHSLSQMNSE